MCSTSTPAIGVLSRIRKVTVRFRQTAMSGKLGLALALIALLALSAAGCAGSAASPHAHPQSSNVPFTDLPNAHIDRAAISVAVRYMRITLGGGDCARGDHLAEHGPERDPQLESYLNFLCDSNRQDSIRDGGALWVIDRPRLLRSCQTYTAIAAIGNGRFDCVRLHLASHTCHARLGGRPAISSSTARAYVYFRRVRGFWRVSMVAIPGYVIDAPGRACAPRTVRRLRQQRSLLLWRKS